MQTPEIIIDQMGCRLEFAPPARRIISLVPSQTELLHALGLEDEVVVSLNSVSIPLHGSERSAT